MAKADASHSSEFKTIELNSGMSHIFPLLTVDGNILNLHFKNDLDQCIPTARLILLLEHIKKTRNKHKIDVYYESNTTQLILHPCEDRIEAEELNIGFEGSALLVPIEFYNKLLNTSHLTIHLASAFGKHGNVFSAFIRKLWDLGTGHAPKRYSPLYSQLTKRFNNNKIK